MHIGAPVRLTGDLPAATAQAHAAVTTAWLTAGGHTATPPAPVPAPVMEAAA